LGFYTAWIGSFFIDVLGQPVGPFFKGQTVWPLKMGQICCSETLVAKYQYTQRQTPE
jgi:hypothetical protein